MKLDNNENNNNAKNNDDNSNDNTTTTYDTIDNEIDSVMPKNAKQIQYLLYS